MLFRGVNQAILLTVLLMVISTTFGFKFMSNIDARNLEGFLGGLQTNPLLLRYNIVQLDLIVVCMILCYFIWPAVFYEQAQTDAALRRYLRYFS